MNDRSRASRFSWLRLLAFAGLIVLAAGLAWVALRRGQPDRGAVLGVPPAIHATLPPGSLGVNVDLAQASGADLERALDAVQRAGLTWVRQPFRWAEIEPERGQFDWAPLDAVVAACHRRGLPVVAVLDTTPPWARTPEDAGNLYAPPRLTADFGRFAAAAATRFGPAVQYYQIWDEPNTESHWGNALIDPVAYMRLLREASVQIRSADPAAKILLGGLSPTTESGPLNMSEPLFLQGLYDAGAAPFFDIVAAKPYGFWSGPEDRRTDLSVLNYSRLVLLRERMVANGDAAKPIWAVEMGWNALPAGWSGAVSPWGTDEEALQADRTLRALDRARVEWPWLAASALAQLGPPRDLSDPRAGFALLDRDGNPRQLYQALESRAQADPVAYPGRHAPDDPAVKYTGGWRAVPAAADPGETGDQAELPFYGTRIDLALQRGQFWGVLYVTIDGRPANRLPQTEEGTSYVVLYDPLEQDATVTLASGLSDGLHRLKLTVDGGWGQWPLREFIVSREASDHTRELILLAAGLLALAGAVGLGRQIGGAPWSRWGPALLGRGDALDERVRLGAFVLLCILFYFAPSAWLSLALLAGIGLFVCLRPELGLAAVTFSIPFLLVTKSLPGKQFGVVELALLVALAGFFVNYGLRRVAAPLGSPLDGPADHESHETNRKPRKTATADRADTEKSLPFFAAFAPCRAFSGPNSFTALDLAMVVLFVASVVSLATAENFGVANREFRVTILEPMLFYFLIRVVPLRRRDVWLLVHALILSGVVIALIGLYQYGVTGNIIFAEGVRRVKGLYASPNNLSLFLGRIVAVLAALVIALPLPRRRLAYAAAAVPIVVCLYLTYSRGAWLLGVPLSILFIALVRRGKTLWGVAAALGLILVSVVPAASTKRMANLFSMENGTSGLRLKLWEGTLHMIRDHPIFGVGLDNFLYQYRTRYILPDAWEEPNLSHPHNIILDYWTRLGLLGLVTLAVQTWAFFRTGFRTYQRLGEGPEKALVLGLLAYMVYSMTHGLIDNSFFLVDLALIFAWASGILCRLYIATRPGGSLADR